MDQQQLMQMLQNFFMGGNSQNTGFTGQNFMQQPSQLGNLFGFEYQQPQMPDWLTTLFAPQQPPDPNPAQPDQSSPGMPRGVFADSNQAFSGRVPGAGATGPLDPAGDPSPPGEEDPYRRHRWRHGRHHGKWGRKRWGDREGWGDNKTNENPGKSSSWGKWDDD